MSIRNWIYTFLNGKKIGVDEFGNRYYTGKGRKLNGRERRWVIYSEKNDASSVPAEWHAWLHYPVDEPLTQIAANSYSWQEPHEVNHTGTGDAYRPKGHDYKGGRRGSATGDYEAWKPD